jgi:hypothetical protein
VDTAEIINKMIDDIIDGNNTDAKDGFESALSTKLTDAIDARKIEIAQSLYNQEVEEDESVQSEE